MNRKIIIGILFCTLVVGTLLWLLDAPETGSAAAGRKQRILSALWAPEYGIRSTDPRGVAFFNELLQTHTRDSVYILERWSQLDSFPGKDSATYIFIGERFGMEDHEFDTLVNFVDSGATMLLVFDHATSNIYNRFFGNNAYYWDYTNKFYLALGDTSLPYYSVFQNDTIAADWYTFDPDAILDSNHQAFIYAMNYPVAYTSKQHKGKFVLHSIPRLFQNYQVIEPNGFSHTDILLRRIPKHRPVIWLEYGRLSNYDAPPVDNGDETGGNDKVDRSYLQYLLKKPALRWAFLLAIATFLLYVAFRAKRREAILPGIPEKRNMSLAFVETLSSIYLSRNSPYSVLQVLRKNFYLAISRHFYIDLMNSKNRDADIRRLVEKADVDEEELRRQLNFLENNNPELVNRANLGEFYRYSRKFYEETGIVRKQQPYSGKRREIFIRRPLWLSGLLLLNGLMALVRCAMLLKIASGYGVLLLLLAIVILLLGIRMLTRPVVSIREDRLTLYRLFRKKQVALDNKTVVQRARTSTTFNDSNGNSITVKHSMLSRVGRVELALLVEHLKKQQTA